MSRAHRRSWRWFTAAMLVAASATFVPAEAGKKGKKKNEKTAVGSIDPTNVPVFDSDAVAAADPMGYSDVQYVAAPMGMMAPAYAVAPSFSAADQIRAWEAHQYATGKGIVVAVLDSGFNLNHPAIAPSLHGKMYDAVDGDKDPTDLGNGFDDDGDGIVDAGVGHGTFVAGMILMAAPDVEIIPIRIRDDEGYGTNSQLRKGIKKAMRYGANLINISSSVGRKAQWKIDDLIEDCYNDKISVVVSAGNDGIDDIVSALYAVPVAAVDAADRMADFSNYEINQEHALLCAPGVDLYGPTGTPTDDSCAWWSGTSFAAPIVTGAAALAMELHPEHSPYEIHRTLRWSMDPVYDVYGNRLEWAGRINLLRVVSW